MTGRQGVGGDVRPNGHAVDFKRRKEHASYAKAFGTLLWDPETRA